jgi:hypothetical protein
VITDFEDSIASQSGIASASVASKIAGAFGQSSAAAQATASWEQCCALSVLVDEYTGVARLIHARLSKNNPGGFNLTSLESSTQGVSMIKETPCD